MNSENPELYALNNGAQREWAQRTWNAFSSEAFSATANEVRSVIDFGCGTGEITSQLATWISGEESASRDGSPLCIVGMDISSEMIEYCRGQHVKGKEEGNVYLSFELADAGDPASMKPAWHSSFDLLVSFTAMHWVPDQRKVLRSMGYCLNVNGLALVLMPMKAPPAFLSSGQVMKERWSRYLADFVPNWRHTPGWEEYNTWRKPDPAEGYRQLAEDAGFTVLRAQVEPFPYLFPNEARVEGMIETLTPYLRRIPETERHQFIHEFAQEYMKSCPTQRIGDEEIYYVWNAECLVVVMRKAEAT